MANITALPRRRNVALWAFVVAGVGLLSILPLTLLNSGSSGSGSSSVVPIAFDRVRIAYFEFGIDADILWVADPKNPAGRLSYLTIGHAPEYGVIPALSPDSRSFAYTVLPEETSAPGPDAPAQVWVASLTGGSPILVASDADLLVPPVWSPDGRTLVFRRSDGTSTALFSVPAAGGPETLLAESSGALFPVGYQANDGSLFYVALTELESQLWSVGSSGESRLAGKLADGLTRDWSLTPDGSRIAYLELRLSGQQSTAQAFIFDLATGQRAVAGSPDAIAFSPVWTEGGDLVVGQLRDGTASTAAVVFSQTTSTQLTAPSRGFDVPLAANATAGAAVTSFSGTSVTNPGRSTLVVVDPAGVRQVIATGEVTFLGWIIP